MKRLRKRQKGSAIMLAVFTTSFVIFLATEVSQQSIMEYLTSATEIKKVQAKYAAQACLKLSLLRIKGYQQAARMLGDQAPLDMLNMVWQFPLSWPPSLPEDLSEFDSSTIQKNVGASLLQHQFVSAISSEGGKIDINDLGSPSQGLRQKTRQQLLDRLQTKAFNGEDSFSERYGNFNFQELINNMVDWVDQDRISLNGGNEQSYYTEFQSQWIPPNRPFKTMEEIHMVAGMTDEIYQVLLPHITLYGVKGVNINQADRGVLLSLFPLLDEPTADQLITGIFQRRNDPALGGPFRDEEDFTNFISSFIDLETFYDGSNRVPLFFGTELNFNISCTGLSGQITREIQAVVYDAASIQNRLQATLLKDQEDQNPRPQCQNLKGEPLYECLCQDKGSQKKINQCKQQQKKSHEKKNQAKAPPPLPPGPPNIIIKQIK